VSSVASSLGARFVVPPPDRPPARGPVPTFSVVIPAYQAADSVAEAVDSALAQTLRPHEVIVADDGSTDAIESALAAFTDRVVVLRLPHRGAAAARNAAVRAATGDFVVMLDADDVYEPERLEALGALAAARSDLDILATDLYYEEAGRLEGRFYDLMEFVVAEQRRGILEACFFACPAMRRSRVLEVGGFDESLELGEDWDLFIRLVLSGSRAGLIDRPLMRYRKHAASATSARARSLTARVTVLEKVRREAELGSRERRFLEGCISRVRSRAVLNAAAERARADERGLSRSLLRSAVIPGLTPTTRFALAAAAVTPVARAQLLRRHERRVARRRIGVRGRPRVKQSLTIRRSTSRSGGR
jgi:glycosyltransferase involved in cell wall biosynthesis